MNRYLLNMAMYLTVALFIFSCVQSESDKTSGTLASQDTNTNTQTQTASVQSPMPFSLQDAESLIGKYYNQQNQKAKYAYYKSVTTNNILIDSSYHKDTILVTANSNGRTWNNPNRDTLTIPFSQQIVLKVYRYQQIWWADKLQAPEAINVIPDSVKK